MSRLQSESVATVQACQCVDQPVKPATNRQRLVMVHPQWGVVATGDEFDPDDFDRIAAECKPALATIPAEDPKSNGAATVPRHVDPETREFAGVLLIPVEGWQPGGVNSLPPMPVKHLTFDLANKLASRWNQRAIAAGMNERKWYLLVSQGKRGEWGVLSVDVPRWWRPTSVRELPPDVMQHTLPGGGYNGERRRLNRKLFETPGTITRWAVKVHAPKN